MKKILTQQPPRAFAFLIFRTLSESLFIGLALLCSGYIASGQHLYGVLSSGGADNLGTLGHYNPSTSSWTTDYIFTTPFPGATPMGDLTEVNGKFYGMTSTGGAHNAGVLFEWDPATNVYTRKVDFSRDKGSTPLGSLTYNDGTLYGMTSLGGAYNSGVIFQWDPVTNVYIKKIDFYEGIGSNPKGSLTYHDNKFYGMVHQGGANRRGVLFEWDPSTNAYTRRVSLDCENGCLPRGSGALAYYQGKFYGMTYGGGAAGTGAIFEWDLSSNEYRKRIDLDCDNGCNPTGSLTLLGEKFYGLTPASAEAGVLFEWDPATNAFSKKVEFTGDNGANPHGSLTVRGSKLYGMTTSPNPGGVIFEYDPATDVFTTKVVLGRATAHAPFGSLTLFDGKFYGLTSGGGNGYGAIIEWDPTSNIFAEKVYFQSSLNGSNPQGSLTYHANKIYGMTHTGGANNVGVIFEFDPLTKTFTKKVDLDLYNGGNPTGSLTYAQGKFYGLTTRSGSLNDFGSLIEWDPSTNIYIKKFSFRCPTGCVPYGSLTYHDGKLYGLTEAGGNSSQGAGVIFEYDPISDSYSVAYSFSIPMGAYSRGSLTLSNDKLFGMTSRGGASGNGVIFEFDPSAGAYQKKIDLENDTGGNPTGMLTKSGNTFYGLTNNGGAHNAGVLFEWDPNANVFTKKVDFSSLDGTNPKGSLTLSGGKIYGMTSAGGLNDLGVIFEWNPVTNAYRKKVDFSSETGGAPVYTQFLEVPAHGPQDFSVVDVRSGEALIDFADRVSLDAGDADFKYMTIRANFNTETVGSVLFRMDGRKINVENKTPFLLQGYSIRALGPGDHSLVAESYTGRSARGIMQQSSEAMVTLVNDTEVSGFEILDRFGQTVRGLQDGDVLDVHDSRLLNMNIRALLTRDAPDGSVRFYLNEAPHRIENQPPYIMISGNRQWFDVPAAYTVRATPYSRKTGKGIPGKSLAVSFSIVNSGNDQNSLARAQEAGAETETKGRGFVTIYPVPAKHVLHVLIQDDTPGHNVRLTIRNIHNHELYNEFQPITSEPFILDLQKLGLVNGIYILQVSTPMKNSSIRFIKE